MKDAVWKKYIDSLSGRTKRAGKKESKKPAAVISRAQAAELKKLASRKAV